MNEEGHGETSYGLQAKDSGPMPPTGAVWSQKSGQAPVPTVIGAPFASTTPRSRARTPPRLLPSVAEGEESDQRANTITSEQRSPSTTHDAPDPENLNDLPGWPKVVSGQEASAHELLAPSEALLHPCSKQNCAEAFSDSRHHSQVQIAADILAKAGESTSDAGSTHETLSEGSTALVSELQDSDVPRCQSRTDSEEQAETAPNEADFANPCESIPGRATENIRVPVTSGPPAGPKPMVPAPWMLVTAGSNSLDAPLPDVDSGIRNPMPSGHPAGPKPREPAPWRLATADPDLPDATLLDVDTRKTSVAAMFSRSASCKLEPESIPDVMPGVVERVGHFSRARMSPHAPHFRPEPEAGADVPAPGFVSSRVAELNSLSLSNSLR